MKTLLPLIISLISINVMAQVTLMETVQSMHKNGESYTQISSFVSSNKVKFIASGYSSWATFYLMDIDRMSYPNGKFTNINTVKERLKINSELLGYTNTLDISNMTILKSMPDCCNTTYPELIQEFSNHPNGVGKGRMYEYSGDYKTAYSIFISISNYNESLRAATKSKDQKFIFDACLYIFNSNSTDSVGITKAIQTLTDIDTLSQTEITTDKIKQTLMFINQKYSKNLITDKVKWEPVIAMIRTSLEVYK